MSKLGDRLSHFQSRFKAMLGAKAQVGRGGPVIGRVFSPPHAPLAAAQLLGIHEHLQNAIRLPRQSRNPPTAPPPLSPPLGSGESPRALQPSPLLLTLPACLFAPSHRHRATMS